MKALKPAYMGTFIIILMGFVYANLAKFGLSAYELGYFYLGGYRARPLHHFVWVC
jgi:hypothetical protein